MPNEVQTISTDRVPNGGDYVLTFRGRSTTAIAFDASNATIQTAVQALLSVGSGNCLVRGTFASRTFAFIGALANQAIVDLITMDGSGLIVDASTININRTQVGDGATVEIQTISFSDGPTSGTATINGQSVSYGASGTDMQGAFDAALGAGIVTVARDGYGRVNSPYTWTITWLSPGAQTLSTGSGTMGREYKEPLGAFWPCDDGNNLLFVNTTAVDLTDHSNFTTGTTGFPTVAGGATLFFRYRYPVGAAGNCTISLGQADGTAGMQLVGHHGTLGAGYIDNLNGAYLTFPTPDDMKPHTVSIRVPSSAVLGHSCNISDLIVYVDSGRVATHVHADGAISFGTMDTFMVGNYYPAASYPFDGHIQQVLVFDNDIGDIATRALRSYSSPGTGCCLYLACSEGTGTTVGDSSGNANNGTSSGAWATITGYLADYSGNGNDAVVGGDGLAITDHPSNRGVAGSLNSAGGNTACAVGTDTGVQGGNYPRTVGGFVRTSDTAGGFYTFLSAGIVATYQQLMIARYSGSAASFSANGNDITAGSISDNTWHLVAMGLNPDSSSTSTGSLSVDATEVGTTWDGAGTIDYTPDGEVAIGGNATVANGGWDGNLCCLFIVNRYLTPTERADVYTNPFLKLLGSSSSVLVVGAPAPTRNRGGALLSKMTGR